jgi:hypothetical protein
MATALDVLTMLKPQGGWAIWNEDFDTIRWDEGIEPLTKKEFEAGFAKFDAWKADQEAQIEAKRSAALAKLEALGRDEDDLKALGL